jgi:LmbE family N-acetylglucosaminyl deacetylase
MGMLQTSSTLLVNLLPAFCKPFARAARAALQKSAENLWAVGFTIAGRIFRSRVEAWSSAGGQRILVIAPHPDDEAIGCAGTILRHKESGDTVCVAYVTDGRRSEALGLSPREMAYRRKNEAKAVARALEIDRFEWFGLPEGTWSDEDLRPRLRSLIAEFLPDLVYAPSRIDVHQQHHQVANVLASLLSDFNGDLHSPLVRIYEVQIPLTPVLTNVVADTSNVSKTSSLALHAYTTQYGSTCRAERKWRYAARFYGTETKAEEFWQMTAKHYHILTNLPPKEGIISTVQPFRPIQFRSYTDPLAYLKGLTERRRLAQLLQQSSRQVQTSND